MSAVKVMRALLLAHPALAALLPADSIVAGTVPQATVLPAIGIKEVSSNEFLTVAQREPGTLVRSRVQVTVYAKSYPEQKRLLQAVKLGPGIYAGIIAGVPVRSVRRGDVGPDFSDEGAGIYEQSRDFFVSFIEPS
jgi:hypothetical protein